MPLDNVQLPKRNDHDNYDFMAIEVHPRSDASSESVAKDVAASQNLLFMGRIGALDNHYLLAMPKTRTLIKRDPVAVTGDLSDHPEVHWVERQVPDKRLFKRFPSSSSTPSMNVISSPSFNTSLGKRGSIGKIPMALEKLDFKDPGFPEQFHLFNRVEIGHDMNLTGVWAQGITGKGVVTTFLDDGVDHDHPDLKNNFFLEGSYDFNEHKKYPTPALSDDFHGTRCAGEVAAEKNDICGVGIAWDSKVSGIRILSGTLTVADEAAAINYEFHKNHIFSCSWGPRDDGRTMDAPPKLAAEAFKKGIVDGRDGKGSIFVFAAGNGGGSGDNCNFDGYTNSIYTITVGAIERGNQHPMYSEMCSANLVVTYSGPHGGQGIYTTDWLGHACTTRHGGTSAAAPLASGVFALVLSIRPDLTWRDLQHLVVQSATPITLEDTDWQDVAMGRKFNHKFGYGVMDGYRIIEAAKRHTLVNPQSSYVIPTQTINVNIPDTGTPLQNKFTVTESELVQRNFSRLEHVTVTVNIKHQRRGDIAVQLISPKGYRSDLLVSRPYDEDPDGFNDWTAMTVKHWDENPLGEWTLQVTDIHPNSRSGQWVNWSMTLWGENGVLKKENNGTLPAPPSPAPPVENKTIVVSTVASVTSAPTSTVAAAPIVTVTPPMIPVGTPTPSGLTTTSILFPTSIGSEKSASDVDQDVTEDDTNGFAIFGGLLFVVILAVGAFSGYIIWRRIVKKRASAASGGNQEDPESYRSLNAGDEEDASSFAREQRGNGNSAQRSSSPPKMQEVLFETGPLDDDEDF